MFYGCGNLMRKKGCSHLEWFDEEMNNHVKDVIRSLKERNDNLMDFTSDTRKKEELLNINFKFMGYFSGSSLVFVFLVIFSLVVTHVLKP